MLAYAQHISRQAQVEGMASVPNPHVQPLHVLGQPWILTEDTACYLDAGRDALNQVDGSRHRAKVDSLPSGAALDVVSTPV